MSKRSARWEDYLKAIYHLSKNGGVHGAEIADYMKLSRPTVCVYLKQLVDKGDITMNSGHLVYLTAQGRAIAESTLDKHEMLVNLFRSLGVPGSIASEDACAIEHSLSPETYTALKNLLHERQARR